MQKLRSCQALLVEDDLKLAEAGSPGLDVAAIAVEPLRCDLLKSGIEVQSCVPEFGSPGFECLQDSPAKAASLTIGVDPHPLDLGTLFRRALQRAHCDDTASENSDEKFPAVVQVQLLDLV